MRFIIEQYNTGDIYISLGTPVKPLNGYHLMTSSEYKKRASYYEYPLLYSNDICCDVGLYFPIHRVANIYVTKHYNSFEEFVENNVELFL